MIAGLVAYKPGRRGHLFYRVIVHRGRKGERRSLPLRLPIDTSRDVPGVLRGWITTAGNAHLRTQLIESAWAHQHHASLGLALHRRQDGIDPASAARSWTAQQRLVRAVPPAELAGNAAGRRALLVERGFQPGGDCCRRPGEAPLGQLGDMIAASGG